MNVVLVPVMLGHPFIINLLFMAVEPHTSHVFHSPVPETPAKDTDWHPASCVLFYA